MSSIVFDRSPAHVGVKSNDVIKEVREHAYNAGVVKPALRDRINAVRVLAGFDELEHDELEPILAGEGAADGGGTVTFPPIAFDDPRAAVVPQIAQANLEDRVSSLVRKQNAFLALQHGFDSVKYIRHFSAAFVNQSDPEVLADMVRTVIGLPEWTNAAAEMVIVGILAASGGAAASPDAFDMLLKDFNAAAVYPNVVNALMTRHGYANVSDAFVDVFIRSGARFESRAYFEHDAPSWTRACLAGGMRVDTTGNARYFFEYWKPSNGDNFTTKELDDGEYDVYVPLRPIEYAVSRAVSCDVGTRERTAWVQAVETLAGLDKGDMLRNSHDWPCDLLVPCDYIGRAFEGPIVFEDVNATMYETDDGYPPSALTVALACGDAECVRHLLRACETHVETVVECALDACAGAPSQHVDLAREVLQWAIKVPDGSADIRRALQSSAILLYATDQPRSMEILKAALDIIGPQHVVEYRHAVIEDLSTRPQDITLVSDQTKTFVSALPSPGEVTEAAKDLVQFVKWSSLEAFTDAVAIFIDGGADAVSTMRAMPRTPFNAASFARLCARRPAACAPAATAYVHSFFNDGDDDADADVIAAHMELALFVTDLIKHKQPVPAEAWQSRVVRMIASVNNMLPQFPNRTDETLRNHIHALDILKVLNDGSVDAPTVFTYNDVYTSIAIMEGVVTCKENLDDLIETVHDTDRDLLPLEETLHTLWNVDVMKAREVYETLLFADNMYYREDFDDEFDGEDTLQDMLESGVSGDDLYEAALRMNDTAMIVRFAPSTEEAVSNLLRIDKPDAALDVVRNDASFVASLDDVAEARRLGARELQGALRASMRTTKRAVTTTSRLKEMKGGSASKSSAAAADLTFVPFYMRPDYRDDSDEDA